MTHADRGVPRHQVDAYARDGVVLVRGLLDADEVTLVERAVDRVLAEPSSLAQVASTPDEPDGSPRTSAAGPRSPRSSASRDTPARPRWPQP